MAYTGVMNDPQLKGIGLGSLRKAKANLKNNASGTNSEDLKKLAKRTKSGLIKMKNGLIKMKDGGLKIHNALKQKREERRVVNAEKQRTQEIAEAHDRELMRQQEWSQVFADKGMEVIW